MEQIYFLMFLPSLTDNTLLTDVRHCLYDAHLLISGSLKFMEVLGYESVLYFAVCNLFGFR